MEKLEEIKLTGKQEIQNISIEPADNGGCVLRFTIYTPSMKHSDSNWDSRTELFDDDEIDTALERIKELYRLNLQGKKNKKGSDEPMKSEGY